MSHYVQGGFKTYVSTNVLPAYTAVKIASGQVVAAAAATDKIIGTVHAASKAGAQIDVRLRSCGGTLNIVVGAGGSIAAGDAVTSDASGLGITTTTAGNQIIGYALEAGAPGAVIELMPSTAKV